jgi:hypothetical protein
MAQVRLAIPTSIQEARDQLQTAIGVEFGTLPPYLYAMFSIPPGENVAAAELIKSVLMEEMVHMFLASNILNAIGGNPVLTPPKYPDYLPGHIGPDGKPLMVSLCPFSPAAMQQGMNIEQPVAVPDFPVVETVELLEAEPPAVTIGQFYAALDAFLATLDPRKDWHPGRNQISDSQFFAGQLFPVNGYLDANRAISIIVSEGEGLGDDPLDFTDEVAHYYRFGEIFNNKVLTKIDQDPGYQWGPQPLGVDWSKVFPAIMDPQTHDFSADPPAAQAAQAACNAAYSQMVDALQGALTGQPAQLGIAVRAMFDLRMATQVALRTPLADGTSVSGPAFVYVPTTPGGTA